MLTGQTMSSAASNAETVSSPMFGGHSIKIRSYRPRTDSSASLSLYTPIVSDGSCVSRASARSSVRSREMCPAEMRAAFVCWSRALVALIEPEGGNRRTDLTGTNT